MAATFAPSVISMEAAAVCRVAQLAAAAASVWRWTNSAMSRCQTATGKPNLKPAGNEIDINTDAQPGGEPQNGQCGSCCNSRRASSIRIVAMEWGLWRSGRTRRATRAELRCSPGGNESKMTGVGRGGKTVPLGDEEPVSRNAKCGVMMEPAPVASFVMPQS